MVPQIMVHLNKNKVCNIKLASDIRIASIIEAKKIEAKKLKLTHLPLIRWVAKVDHHLVSYLENSGGERKEQSPKCSRINMPIAQPVLQTNSGFSVSDR